MTTVRIFIGCAANHEDAESQAVLEHTIRKHATLPVEITWMKLSRDPGNPFYSSAEKAEGWCTEHWATPFSGFRWAIPELCGFEGRAIYSDSDVIVRSDIADLWNQHFEDGKVIMAKGRAASWRYCVSMWNCERAKALLPSLDQMRRDPDAHRKLCRFFADHPDIVQAFDGNWNCLDGEDYDSLDDPEIKAIHYTSMRHQPHLRYAVARLAKAGRRHWFDGEPARHWRSDVIDLFDRLLEEATANGCAVANYEQDPLFGPYRKRSVARQGLTLPPWAKRSA